MEQSVRPLLAGACWDDQRRRDRTDRARLSPRRTDRGPGRGPE